MKKLKCLLWLFVFAVFLGSAATVQAEDSTESAFTQDESYTTRSFLDLKQYLDTGDGITVTDKTSANGILLTSQASTFNSTKIKINKTFCFDGNRLGRVAVDALAGYGTNLKINLYLDDEEESFATITPKKQGRSDGWTKDVCLQEDVLSKNITGEHTISFSVSSEDSGEVAILLRSIEFVESNLPVIYMNIDESLGSISSMTKASLPGKNECYGDFQIQTPSGYSYEFGDISTNQTDTMENYDMDYITGMDYANWFVTSKRSYSLILTEKQSLLGMDAGKNWALLGGGSDNSSLRNQMSFWIARELGMDSAAQCVPVDLVMNGVYYGSYLLAEGIYAEDTRLDISEDNGYIVSVIPDPDPTDDGYIEPDFETTNDMGGYVEYPKSADDDTVASVKADMQKVEDAIFGEDFKDENGISYEEYLDMDSTLDMFLFYIASENLFPCQKSCIYLYKNSDGKLHWGPVWEMDYIGWNAAGDMDPEYMGDTTYLAWMNRLLLDPEFTQKLIDRWPSMKAKIQECIADGGTLDQYYNNLSISERYDVEKWGMYIEQSTGDDSYDDSYGDGSEEETLETYSDSDTTDTITYAGEKEKLITWINNRVTWLDENIGSLKVYPCKITFMVDSKEYTTRSILYNAEIGTLPSAPEKSGYEFMGWSYYDEESEDDVYADQNSTFTKDTVLTAVYTSDDELIQAEELYIDHKEIWIPISQADEDGYPLEEEGNPIVLNYTVYPEDAYGDATYTSSDTSVVVVDEPYLRACFKTGEATVTISYGKKKATCLVHVYDPDTEDISFGTTPSISESNITLSIGKRKQLYVSEGKRHYKFYRYSWFSADSSIASVDNCGVITAVKSGTTYIYLKDHYTGDTVRCKVTVPVVKSTVKKGYVYTYKGLKYKVTYKAKKGGNVTILKPNSKKIKAVNIRSTLKIKGETYKVTAISAKAFYKCKNLRKITMGKNIKSIGNKAFTGINKKAVFKVPASKKKAYKKLLTSKKGFRKTMKVTK